MNRRIRQVTSGAVRHYYYSADWRVLEERLGNSELGTRRAAVRLGLALSAMELARRCDNR
ncbi:MAG: hypothetical protein JNK76_03615 [Planctomycetales bacterium]|nr:hypothetical protein [Planctomycetales bacterium]